MALFFGLFSYGTFVITFNLRNRTICILKQDSVIVASGQMATLDSPGSALMKWTTLKLLKAEIKHLKFLPSIFSSHLPFVENIYSGCELGVMTENT